MIKYADTIVDLQAGDTGKGKVAHALASTKNEYTHVIRYNGGGNAGHTFYHNGEKFVTHYIPIGVMYNIKSIIGPGCVVNIVDLMAEITALQKRGIPVQDYLFIDKRVHIITTEHLAEELDESVIGTTKTGNGPAYRDKYHRKGKRAQDMEILEPYLIDIYEELHSSSLYCKILFEGAQGFELDIDWGDYPYVTSSHCTIGGALLNGVPPQKVRKVVGTAKAYNTYVGAKMFEGEDKIFAAIRIAGAEYGATTGRPRQVNWIDMDKLIMAANINGITELIINKLDVLEDVNVFKFYLKGELHQFKDSEQFCRAITGILQESVPTLDRGLIQFSRSALSI